MRMAVGCTSKHCDLFQPGARDACHVALASRQMDVLKCMKPPWRCRALLTLQVGQYSKRQMESRSYCRFHQWQAVNHLSDQMRHTKLVRIQCSRRGQRRNSCVRTQWAMGKVPMPEILAKLKCILHHCPRLCQRYLKVLKSLIWSPRSL